MVMKDLAAAVAQIAVVAAVVMEVTINCPSSTQTKTRKKDISTTNNYSF